MTTATRLVLVMAVLLHAAGAAAQSPRPDESSPRITILEAWLSAVDRHRPGTFDLSVGLVSGLNQEQLRLIWIDVRTIVSLVRVPDVSVFYITEDSGASTPRPAGGSRRVLYTSANCSIFASWRRRSVQMAGQVRRTTSSSAVPCSMPTSPSASSRAPGCRIAPDQAVSRCS